MFVSFKSDCEVNVTQTLNEIEKEVYEVLKPLGFKKFGRTLHRFVSEDISQVVNFQTGLAVHGMSGLFCVNVGIRIPECAERRAGPQESKKYYREYECTLRSRLGRVSGGGEIWYDLRDDTSKTADSIKREISEFVLPIFNTLTDRESILLHSEDFPSFEVLSTIDACMIYYRLGDFEKAKEAFESHYRAAVEKYNDMTINGNKLYLRKGNGVCYMGQYVVAEEDGYVTLYGASHAHIDRLDELAVKMGFR